MKILTIFILVWGLGTQAPAAPFPVTSSSVLTDPSFGLFYRSHGFSLKSVGSDWILQPPDNNSSAQGYQYKIKDRTAQQAQFSLKMDHISAKQNLDGYAKKWMREYPQFGFEVLGTKPLKMGGGNALLIDLFQKNKNQQLRQLILQKNSKIVIMTCSDEMKNFKKTITQCNQMMSNFNWL